MRTDQPRPELAEVHGLNVTRFEAVELEQASTHRLVAINSAPFERVRPLMSDKPLKLPAPR